MTEFQGHQDIVLGYFMFDQYNTLTYNHTEQLK